VTVVLAEERVEAPPVAVGEVLQVERRVAQPVERRVAQRVAQPVERRVAQRVERPVAQPVERRVAQRVERPVAQRVERPVAQRVVTLRGPHVAVRAGVSSPGWACSFSSRCLGAAAVAAGAQLQRHLELHLASSVAISPVAGATSVPTAPDEVEAQSAMLARP
jgi:hypothetical protein